MASKLSPNVLYVAEHGDPLGSPQADSERTHIVSTSRSTTSTFSYTVCLKCWINSGKSGKSRMETKSVCVCFFGVFFFSFWTQKTALSIYFSVLIEIVLGSSQTTSLLNFFSHVLLVFSRPADEIYIMQPLTSPVKQPLSINSVVSSWLNVCTET